MKPKKKSAERQKTMIPVKLPKEILTYIINVADIAGLSMSDVANVILAQRIWVEKIRVQGGK